MQYGHVFIITNALAGWVEQSTKLWFPEVQPMLQKVNVISARSLYEKKYVEVRQWKIHTFLEVQRRMDSELVTNLLSLGDSDFETEAAHVMGAQFSSAFIKTVKFHVHPTPEELLRQLESVASKFEKIVTCAQTLKL